MTCIVPRTCREVSSSNSRARSELTSQPVEAWEDKAAYVLLGAPGAGKTTTFKHEAERHEGVYVTVRDFLTSDDKPEWYDTTLFVDGLDESRAGTADGRTPLDRIRAKLERIGCPRFRLSCRETDWFGRNDSDNLKTVSPDGTITVLRLEPLSGDDFFSDLECISRNRQCGEFHRIGSEQGPPRTVGQSPEPQNARGCCWSYRGLAQHQDAGV